VTRGSPLAHTAFTSAAPSSARNRFTSADEST
jgi:hypothetical protein